MTSSWPCTLLVRSASCFCSVCSKSLTCYETSVLLEYIQETTSVYHEKPNRFVLLISQTLSVCSLSPISGTVLHQLCYIIWLSEIFISCVKTDSLWSLTHRRCSAPRLQITRNLDFISGHHILLLCRILTRTLLNVARGVKNSSVQRSAEDWTRI